MEEKDIKSLSHEVPFTIPEGYFENFEARLKTKMEQEELLVEKPKFKISYNKIIAYVAVAVFAIVIVSGVFLYTNYLNRSVEAQLTEITAYDEFIDDLYDDYGSINIEDILADVEY